MLIAGFLYADCVSSRVYEMGNNLNQIKLVGISDGFDIIISQIVSKGSIDYHI